MSIKGDFTQVVTVDGYGLFTSDLSIRESESEPISQIDFSVASDVQGSLALSALKIDGAVVVTQSAQGRSMTWLATISSVSIERQDHSDVYRVKCMGEAEALTRRRFTAYDEETTTATGIIKKVIQDFAQYAGLSDAGVQENPIEVGPLSAIQDTPLAVIDKAVKRSGWTWGIMGGVVYFQPADQYTAPFSLQSGVNIARSGFRFSEDSGEMQNVIKAEAFEYKEVTVEANVKGCARLIFGERQGVEWEYSGTGSITSPEELKDVELKIDPLEGEIEFRTPLVLQSELPDPIPEGWDPAKEQEFPVRVVYTVRRRVIVERRDAASIDIYGERHGAFRASSGPDDVESVHDILATELTRKAYPLVTASASVLDFGLRAGMTVAVLPFGRSQSLAMRVSSLRHTTKGAELEVSVELATRTFYGSDVVPEILSRVESLEKRPLDPESASGSSIIETGSISSVSSSEDTLSMREEIEFFIAGIASFSGGGSMSSEAGQFSGTVVRFSGGGSMIFDGSVVSGGMAKFSGGGDMSAVRFIEFGSNIEFTGAGSLSAVSGAAPAEVVKFSGAGHLSLTGEMITVPDGALVTENEIPIVTESGTYIIIEDD